MYATGDGDFRHGARTFSASTALRPKTASFSVATNISDMLSNPIYYGHFRYAGEVHEGKHEPIISKELV